MEAIKLFEKWQVREQESMNYIKRGPDISLQVINMQNGLKLDLLELFWIYSSLSTTRIWSTER